MTKQQLKDQVGMGFFSIRWLMNDGEEGYIHRAILGLNKRGF